MKSIVLFFILTLSVYSHKCTAQVSKVITGLNKDTALKHASWSIYAVNSKTDSVIADYNSLMSLVPASTLKIITTSAALGMLGKDFTFKTQLQYSGNLDSLTGILKGDLYILGGGDPTLESEYFKNDSLSIIDQWAIILKSKGIKKIEGAIIGDDEIFENNLIPDNWIWGDIGNYYGAGACGLSYRDNKYKIYFKSSSWGTETKLLYTDPKIEGLQLINEVIAGSKNDSAYVYGAPYSSYRKIQGAIPANKNKYEVEAALPDPALSCAQALEQALKKQTILTSEKATTTRILKEAHLAISNNRKTIHTHYSPALDKIVYWTNLKSINLYAEHLLKFIGYKKTGIGTEATGILSVTNYWKDRGVDIGGMVMMDGSGLSRSNLITTKTQVQILAKMLKDKNFDSFYKSFPVAGKAGSLGSLCIGSSAENNLRAKSGYINLARGYCGYVKNKKGEIVCFSVLANNYECTPTEMKQKLEKLLIAIAETN